MSSSFERYLTLTRSIYISAISICACLYLPCACVCAFCFGMAIGRIRLFELCIFLARDEVINPSILTNGDSQRRIPSANRQHLSETVRRLAKPRNMAMTQSIHIGASSSSSNGIPLSRSSHQIRLTTPPVATTSSATRRVNDKILSKITLGFFFSACSFSSCNCSNFYYSISNTTFR